MKNLGQDKVEQLLQLINNKPDQHIVHFSDGSHILSKNLNKWCKEHHGYYYIYSTKDAFYDKSMTKYANHPHVHIVKFNLNRTTYIRQDLEYDYLIATVDFTQEDKTVFLKKCTPILKTGGNIILFIPNSTCVQREEWKDILIEQCYTSPQLIDDLFEEYTVIVAKRL